MQSNGLTVIINGDQEGGNLYTINPDIRIGSHHIEEIEKRFIERFNRLAEKSFSTVPFDEDMWDYLHALQKEILDLGEGPVTGREFEEWNDPAHVNDYCESVHGKLSKCEKELGVLRSHFHVY